MAGPISLSALMPRASNRSVKPAGYRSFKDDPFAVAELTENYDNNPGNETDLSDPLGSPRALSTTNQINNPTSPIKDPAGPPEINNTANAPGLAIFPGGGRPKTFEDVARDELGFSDPKYPKRGFGDVLKDIGSGALRGIAGGKGAIGGAMAGGLGQYRQADRDAQVKARAGEIANASEEIRKNINMANVQENTASLSAQRKANADIATRTANRKDQELQLNAKFKDMIGKAKMGTLDLANQKLLRMRANDVAKQIAEQGPYMDPEVKARLMEEYQELSGLELDSNYGENVLKTKQDLAPRGLYDASDGPYTYDRFGREPAEKLLDDSGDPLESLKMRLKREGMFRGPRNPRSPEDDVKLVTSKKYDILRNETGVRGAYLPKKGKAGSTVNVDFGNIKMND